MQNTSRNWITGLTTEKFSFNRKNKNPPETAADAFLSG
jgi:hypothetical protein